MWLLEIFVRAEFPVSLQDEKTVALSQSLEARRAKNIKENDLVKRMLGLVNNNTIVFTWTLYDWKFAGNCIW